MPNRARCRNLLSVILSPNLYLGIAISSKIARNGLISYIVLVFAFAFAFFFFCYFITSSQGVQENSYPTDHSFVTNFSPEGNVPLRLSNRNDWIYCTKMTQKRSSPCCILSSINTENNRRFISSYIEKKEKKEKKLCVV